MSMESNRNDLFGSEWERHHSVLLCFVFQIQCDAIVELLNECNNILKYDAHTKSIIDNYQRKLSKMQ